MSKYLQVQLLKDFPHSTGPTIPKGSIGKVIAHRPGESIHIIEFPKGTIQEPKPYLWKGGVTVRPIPKDLFKPIGRTN